MPKFVLDILFAFGGMFLISYFFYSSTNWKELSDKYSCPKKSNVFLYIVEERAYINEMAINGLNVGVSQEGLFLSFPPLLGFILASILIPWNDISYREDVNNPQTKNYIFDLGDSKVAVLKLSYRTVEDIHENYGEPIFFERLGEPS